MTLDTPSAPNRYHAPPVEESEGADTEPGRLGRRAFLGSVGIATLAGAGGFGLSRLEASPSPSTERIRRAW